MFKLITCSSILVLFAIGALAQSPLIRKEFDVVSVKPSAPDEHNSFAFQSLPGGTIRMLGVPLQMMIMGAYSVKAFQVSGGPDWIRTGRWDVLAKADGFQGRIPRDQENVMIQSMMADRFRLKVHSETKEMPVFALVVDKGRSKLTPHAGGPPPPGQGQRIGRGMFSVQKGNMAALAAQLSVQLGRIVIDKTDLKGEYDFTLTWTPEPGQGGPESIGLPPGTEPPPADDSNGPSIFTAVQEQLGLRLDSQKGPVEILVIDRAEKASEN